MRPSGTSAGAIAATLIAANVAAGSPPAGLRDQIASIDYTKFTTETGLRKHAGKIGDLHALMTSMGLYSGDYLVEWLGGILETIGITTFGQLRRDDLGVDFPYSLVVHTTDITLGKLVRLPGDMRRELPHVSRRLPDRRRGAWRVLPSRPRASRSCRPGDAVLGSARSSTDLAGPHRVVVVLVGGDEATAQRLLDRRTRNRSIVGAPHSGGLAEQLSVGSRQRSAAQIVRGDELAQLQERRTLTVDRVARLQHVVVWELDEHEVVKQILARRKSYDATARAAPAPRPCARGVGPRPRCVPDVPDAAEPGARPERRGARRRLLDPRRVPILVAALIAVVSVPVPASAGCRAGRVRGDQARGLRLAHGYGCVHPQGVDRQRDRSRRRPQRVSTDSETGSSDGTELLVNRVAAIEAQLLGSAVASSTVFAPVDDAYLGATDDDDGLSRLTADDYLRVRVNDQLAYYRRKVKLPRPGSGAISCRGSWPATGRQHSHGRGCVALDRAHGRDRGESACT